MCNFLPQLMQRIPHQQQVQISKRLRQMNWHWGRGDVADADFETGQAKRKIPISPGHYHYEYRKFRVDGDTVYFLGHRSNYTREMKL